MTETNRTVLVPVAHGSEEIETVCIVDTLRRAGAIVLLASIEDDMIVKCSRNILIQADVFLKDIHTQEFDLIVLPGGMPGAQRLKENQILRQMLQKQKDDEKYFAAICAAPAVVLESHGLLKETKATSHPNFSEQLSVQSHIEERVVFDESKKVVTSRGPGTAIEFALTLVSLLFGNEKAIAVANPMLVKTFGQIKTNH